MTTIQIGSSRLFAQLQPPLAPSMVGVVLGSRVNLVWLPNTSGSPATAYQLEAGTASGLSDVAIIQVPATPTSFSADAPPGTYYVRVRGVNAAGVGPASNDVFLPVGDAAPCAPPSIPTGLTATTTASGVTIQWNAPASGGTPTSYRLDAGSTSGATNIGSFALPPTTIVSSPAPAGPYFVRLTAINTCGSSAPSAELSFVIGGSFNPALLVGTWTGQMFNQTRNPPGRVPITSFSLRLDQAPPISLTRISGRWSDNAGCQNTNIFGSRNSQGSYVVFVEALTCNDGDLSLTFTSITQNRAEGRCNGGTNCTFVMTR
jgi:predicted phage tail protein